MNVLSYVDSLTSGLTYKPVSAWPSSPCGAYEYLAKRIASATGLPFKLSNGATGFHPDGATRGSAARPAPGFTIEQRERFVIEWLRKVESYVPEALITEYREAMAIAGHGVSTVEKSEPLAW